jgi:glycosyltransferase involved in cell wall biosynthesis
MTSVCAIIAVRNEQRYLPTLFEYLREQAVDVFLIDNDSHDASRDIIAQYRYAPVLSVTRAPFSGVHDLAALLRVKEQLIGSLRHDWIIHQDADELLESAVEGESLTGLAARADSTGVDVVDFDEFVFLPKDPAGYAGGDYRRDGSNYYFHQPRPFRLNRMFRRASFLSFGDSGGHNAAFRPDPVVEAAHSLRHYIVLDQAHAQSKYAERRFSPAGVARGWHGNRLNIPVSAMDLSRAIAGTARLDHPESRGFDRSNPKSKHFWEW